MEFESLKGFRDFYPDEQSARRQVFDVIHETARAYGFDEVASPSLEPLELYEVKSGEEIVQETYSFEDKGGRRVTMTPELTPSLVRMYVAREQEMSKPVRWFALPKLWRYEQPQSGRLREFYQPNFDIFGADGVEADAEIIAAADAVLRRLGLTDEYELRVSHRGVVHGVVSTLDVDDKQATTVHRTVDKAERLAENEVRERLVDAGLEDEDIETVVSLTRLGGWDAVEDVLELTDDEKTREAVERLRALSDALEPYGVDTVFDPSIVRGMDYYTGVVFECFDTEGDLRAIFGGGRYDTLVEEFGGPSTPAVGFGIGDATLELLMRQAGVWFPEETTVDYYVAVIGDVRETATRVAQSLRKEGHEVEIDVTGRGFSGQLEHADTVGARKTVIVGERDLEDDEVTVKDMESGEQKQVPVEEFV
ncbi:MAG: histidine--tRNA ligase [Halobacteriales archaeon]|nr:histidine--tRNA ligase [Halobacteriales archaeon]